MAVKRSTSWVSFFGSWRSLSGISWESVCAWDVDAAGAGVGRQAENRLGDLEQVRIGEDAVFAGHGRRDALEIEGELNADVSAPWSLSSCCST